MNSLLISLIHRYQKENIFVFLIYAVTILFAFILPLYKSVTPVLAGILFLLSMVHTIRERGGNIHKPGLWAMACMLFYAALVVGLAYTSDLHSGLFDLEVKLSMLVIPLIFISFGTSILDGDAFHYIKMSFVAGTFMATIICLGHAAYYSFITYFTFDNFLYAQLSVLFHPSYFAMYLNLSIVILILNLTDRWENLTRWKKAGLSLLAFYFVVFIILVNSKAGWIVAAITVFPLIIHFIVKRHKVMAGLLVLVVLLGASTLIMTKVPYVMNRFSSFLKVAHPSAAVGKGHENDGTTARMLIWENSLDIIVQHLPFGVGTGDVQSALNKSYTENGFPEGTKKKLNAHNQFLQTTIALGLPGFMLLLFILLYGLIKGMHRKELFPVFLAIILISNFFVESMLETQAGVVFSMFFLALADRN